MKTTSAIRSLLLTALLVAATSAGTALAQVNLNISLAPPAPQYEAVPTVPLGHAWAPGYWAWNGDRYIWIRGRQIVQRTGSRWEPDRWEHRDGHYYRHTGRWERDRGYKAAKYKHKDKHYGGRGHVKHGQGGKHGHGGKGHGKHG